MPTITVAYQDLCQLAHLPASMPLAALDRDLSLVKGELGHRAANGLPLQDGQGAWLPPPMVTGSTLDIRIELKDTNRPDLWCVEGIARHLRDHRTGAPRTYAFTTTAEQPLTIEVDSRLLSIRPYIGGFLARGHILSEVALRAFLEGQEALTRNFGRRRKTVSIGLYRGGEIVFPLRYQAVQRDEVRFVPLAPAVETDPLWNAGQAMTPEEILHLHPIGQEYAWILEGMAQVPYLTDARGEALSLPPIINSTGVGRVQPGATDLLVEATGEDLDQVLLTLNILAANLTDRDWTIIPLTTHYSYPTPRGLSVTTPHPLAFTQHVPRAEFARIMGAEVSPDEVTASLAAYGVMSHCVEDVVVATLPEYRQDYLHGVDVIEDYAISRGYEQIAPHLPSEFTVGALDPKTEFEDGLRDLLIGFGFEELFCNILTSADTIRGAMEVQAETVSTTPDFHGGPAVHVANVMNRNYSHLRDWVLPSLLEVESLSTGALYPHRTFEVGEIARYDPNAELGSRTESRLAALIADDSATFDSAQSVLYALLAYLGISFDLQRWHHPSFIPGRVALVIATSEDNGRDTSLPLGFLGELSPQVLTHWGARTPAAGLELSVEALMAVSHGLG